MSELSFRLTTPSDLEPLTEIMNEAFEPLRQFDYPLPHWEMADLEKYVLDDGITVTDLQGNTIGCVCIREAKQTISENHLYVERPYKKDQCTLYKDVDPQELENLSLTYFYRLAVSPKWGKRGIGRGIYEWIETNAKMSQRHGILLETGKEVQWLSNWYERLGFETIGEDQVGDGAHTIMMLKKFS